MYLFEFIMFVLVLLLIAMFLAIIKCDVLINWLYDGLLSFIRIYQEKPSGPPVDYTGKLLDPLNNSELNTKDKTAIKVRDLNTQKVITIGINTINARRSYSHFLNWYKLLIPGATYIMDLGQGMRRYTLDEITGIIPDFLDASWVLNDEEFNHAYDAYRDYMNHKPQHEKTIDETRQLLDDVNTEIESRTPKEE